MMPLDLPLRALQNLQDGRNIRRGTLQAKWYLKSLNEGRDLGLSHEWLQRYECAKVKYLICAQVALTDGPVADRVEVGDILLELDDYLVMNLF